MTTLSVLICTYNRPQLLNQCLTSLLDGCVEKPDQIVVVNGGDNRSDDIVARFSDRNDTSVMLVKTRNVNLAVSRSVGLPYCAGDIVAMTDDDAEVFPDWVTQMKRVHAQHPEAGAVGGPVLGTNTGSLADKIADVITFPCWPDPRYVRTLPGVNISYKREVVERLGPQDSALFRGEDVEYNWRLQQLDYRVYFHPDVKVFHHHRPTIRALANQHYMYGRAYYLVRSKWPEMYCVYPHRLRHFKDILKAMNFMAAVLYEPVLTSRRISPVRTRFASLPILCWMQIAWRAGMLVQRLAVLASTLRQT